MSVTHLWYAQAVVGQFGSTAARRVDWPADTIAVTLHTNSYTFDQDTHDFRDDLSNEVANGNGYTTGGIELQNKAVTYDSGTNVVSLEADNISWADSTITARRAAVQKTGTAGASTDPLLSCIDFGSDKSTEDGTFAINWPADGVLKATVA